VLVGVGLLRFFLGIIERAADFAGVLVAEADEDGAKTGEFGGNVDGIGRWRLLQKLGVDVGLNAIRVAGNGDITTHLAFGADGSIVTHSDEMLSQVPINRKPRWPRSSNGQRTVVPSPSQI